LQQQAFKNETASRAGHHSKLHLYLFQEQGKSLSLFQQCSFDILDTSRDQSKEEMSPFILFTRSSPVLYWVGQWDVSEISTSAFRTMVQLGRCSRTPGLK